MKVRLYHHVYTSVQGYRTQYVSPELPEQVVTGLEDLAQRTYPHVRAQSIQGFVRMGGAEARGRPSVGMCLVRAFQYQTDQSGRPRACVHTIYIPEEEVARHPFLNPLGDPDRLFMEHTDSLNSLGEVLPQVAEFPEFNRQYAAAKRALKNPRGFERLFLRALLTGSHALAVVGHEELALKALAGLWPLLPPRTRHRLSYLRSSLPLDLGPFGRPDVLFLDASEEKCARLEDEGVLVFADSAADDAVTFAGSDGSFQGLLYAPNGMVQTGGSTNSTLKGGIIADRVGLNGSSLTIIGTIDAADNLVEKLIE